MSAWVVDSTHIDVLLAFGLSDPSEKLRWLIDGEGPWDAANVRELTYGTATAVGRTLFQDNIASVCFRYSTPGRTIYYGEEAAAEMEAGGSDTADLYEAELAYTFTDPNYVLTPGELFKAVACLDYQSCEHDGWASSESRRILDALNSKAMAKLYSGPWGWSKADLAAKPKQISLYRLAGGE